MPPLFPAYTLVDRRQLTHDVYELTFRADPALPPVAGQFITFILPSGLRRSYSISDHRDGHFSFIIKQLVDGAGSPQICQLPMGETIS